MPIIDMNSFDGSRIDSELAKTFGVSFRRTSLSLIAMSQGCFVVVTGIDKEETPFTDTEIEKIFVTFNRVVDENSTDTPQGLRLKIETALAPMWTPCPTSNKCPFNLNVKMATRLVFHLHIPGWSFEEARLKLKTLYKPGEFSDLTWLSLNGRSQEPISFSITDRDTEKKVYEFALYTLAEQSGSEGSTRIIIDPETDNNGMGP